MGLFARVLKAVSGMIFPSGNKLWNWLLPRTKFDYAKEVGDGHSSSVIMGPVLWVARTFPEAPLAVADDGELSSEHAMLDLVRRPNPFYSGITLMMATAINFVLQGNAYWLKVRNNQRAVKQLWHIPYWMMEPKWDKDGKEYITHYNYSPDANAIKVDVEDVVHFRFGLDDRNIRKGLAPLYSLVREVFTDDEAANYTATILKNAGVPGLVISPEGDMLAQDDDAGTVKDWFKKMFSGDKRGEPLVMKSATRVEQFGFSPSEMDIGKLRNIPEERVTAVLGVPAAVVGFGTGLQQTKVGATMAEMREMAYENCIIPMQRIIADDINNQLLRDFETNPKIVATFNRTEIRVLQEDQNRLSERVDRAIRGGWLTVAAGQRIMGMRVDDSQNVYLRNALMMPIPEGTTPEPFSFGSDGEEEKRIKMFIPTKVISARQQQELMLRFARDEKRLAQQFENELIAIFEDIGEQAARIWIELAEERGIEQLNAADGIPKKDGADPFGSFSQGIDQVYAELIADQIDFNSFDYSLHYLQVAKSTFSAIKGITGLAVMITDQDELHIISTGGTRKGLIDLDRQTKDALFKVLEEARTEGFGPPKVARMIRDQIPAGPWSSANVRSKIIASTETKYAQNASSLQAYKQAPEVTELQIIDAQLGPTDDFCEQVNGQIVSFEYAETLLIEEHPNGTRSFSPVVSW